MFPRVTWLPLFLATLCAVFALVRLLTGISDKVREIQTLSNLKRIGTAVYLSRDSQHNRPPDLTSLAALRAGLVRLDLHALRDLENINDDDLWRSPGWDVPYATNWVGGHRSTFEMENPGEVAVVYEPQPLWQGKTKRGVAFADGHAKIVGEEDWKRIKVASGIGEFALPTVAPWWKVWASGPREPVSDRVLAGLWGLGYLLFVLLAAGLRRKAFGRGVLLSLAVCGLMAIFGFLLLAQIGRVGWLN